MFVYGQLGCVSTLLMADSPSTAQHYKAWIVLKNSLLLTHHAHCKLPNASTVTSDLLKMLYSTLVSAAALITAASALQITAPTNSSGWVASGANLIEWDVSDISP